MKDYYNLFIELSLQQCAKKDYANKTKVRTHNAASKKLRQLQTEMEQNVSSDIWYTLLNYEDDRVKVNAAAFCLQKEILTEQAINVLKKITVFSEDPTISLSAKMLLQSVNN